MKPYTAIAKRSLQATLAALLTLGLSSVGALTAHAEGTSTATISGVVTLGGQLAAGIEVCASIPSATASYPCVTTSEDGGYEFNVPVSGTTEDASVWVDETAEHLRGDSGYFLLEPGKPVVKDIAIKSFATVSGKVVNKSTGQPIEGATVCASETVDPGAPFCATTDSAGDYSTRAFSLSPKFTVFVDSPGYLSAKRFNVKAGQRVAFNLVAAKVAGSKPKILGKVKVGKRLAAKVGAWGPEGVQLSYQWLRNGKAISGATAATYKLIKADRGKKIKVKVTGRADGYVSVSKTSKATKKVAKR